jgi:hypothetical protein
MVLRLATSVLALSACTTDVLDDDRLPFPAPTATEVAGTNGTDDPDDTDTGPHFEEQGFTPVTADMCDEPTYTVLPWKTLTTPHFTLQFPGSSAPNTDRTEIAARLEAAYADIRMQLGITAAPQLIVNLSPSRVAAQANNKGMGRVWPNLQRYDVVYTGAADSYERVRYGQLLTRALDFYTDSMNRYRVPVLATGVAELLDQSARNLHDEYAKLLVAGVESRVRIAELDSGDVDGDNTGRSGSLVQFLVDRYGMEMFRDIYRATAVVWNGACYSHGQYGCLDTAAHVTAMLDGTLAQVTGESWADIQPLWQAQVEDALARVTAGMDAATISEVANLLAVMDSATANNDAALYRTTVEGFYCDWGGDAAREELSMRAVTAYGATQTTLLALYDTGIKNFATATALVMRVADDGLPMFQSMYVEHLPVGWRVTYSPDWY